MMKVFKIPATLFYVLGSIFLAYYMAFFLMSHYTLTDSRYFSFLGFFAMNSPMFSGHIFALAGTFLLFVAGLLVKVDNPVLFRKIKAIILDGIVLVVWLFLVCGAMIKENDGTISLFSSYEFEALRYKIIGLNIFFILYYLIAEKFGGTFGKRQFGLTSIGADMARLNFTKSLLKTFSYGLPFFCVLLIILFAKMYPFVELHPARVITEAIKFQILQWLCFSIYLFSLIAMFTLSESKSLADVLSNTLVIENNDITTDKKSIKENDLN